MTLALHGKSTQRQWLLVAIGLLAVMVALGAALTSTSTPVGADGEQHSPEACTALAGNVNGGVATADSGNIINVICIKSGSNTFGVGDHSDLIVANGAYGNGDCFVVSGMGTNQVTVTSTGSGCKGVSHIDFGQVPGGDPPSAEIAVSKTAETSYIRTCEWTIAKSTEQGPLSLPVGGSVEVDYTVEVTVACTDSDWTVSGQITVTNGGNVPVTVTSITDDLGGTLTCDPVLSAALEPAGVVTCDYEVPLLGAIDGENTATATATWAEGSLEESSVPKEYTFGEPDEIVDECVSVDDDQFGHLGDPCYDDEDAPLFTYPYSLTVNAGEVGCTTFNYDNTATVSNLEEEELDSDTATVVVTVTCVNGKTQGFWGNKNGQALIPSNFSYVLGDGATCVETVEKADTKIILPGAKTGHNGLTLMPECDLAAGISAGAFNNLLSQTLALRLNQDIPGYDGQTINGLNCTAYVGATGLTGTSTIQDVLDAANAAIAAGGTNAGDFNALLGCLNREA